LRTIFKAFWGAKIFVKDMYIVKVISLN